MAKLEKTLKSIKDIIILQRTSSDELDSDEYGLLSLKLLKLKSINLIQT